MNDEKEFKMLEVGDILVCKFGYNCTLVNFYKVLSKTSSGKSVRLAEIGSRIVDNDGYGQSGHVMPFEDEIKRITGIKRISQSSYNGDFVKIDTYQYAYKWDGNKVHFDSYD